MLRRHHRELTFASSSVFAAILVAAVPGRTDEAPTVSLTYSAPESCPPMVMFINQLRERNPGVEFGSAHHAGFEIVVDITRSRTESQAKISITGPHALRMTETVARQTCSEVVTALVQVATKTLSHGSSSESAGAARTPQTATSASPPDSSRPGKGSTPATQESAPTARAPEPASTTPSTSKTPPLAPQQSASSGKSAPSVPSKTPSSPARESGPVGRAPTSATAKMDPSALAAAGVSGDETSFGLDAAMILAGGGALGVGASVYAGHAYAGRYSPSWRVGFHAALANVGVPLETVTGSAKITWVAVQASVSPTRVRLVVLDIAPSVQMEGGGLTVEPSPEVAPTSSVRGPWFAAGGALRIEWRMSSLLAVGAQGDVMVPFHRDPFVLGSPPVSVYEPPSILVRAGAGVRLVVP